MKLELDPELVLPVDEDGAAEAAEVVALDAAPAPLDGEEPAAAPDPLLFEEPETPGSWVRSDS